MPVDQLSLTTNNKFSYNQFMLGDYSKLVPPDPISNSEVKQFSAYDSVELPCQSRSSPSFNTKKPRTGNCSGLFYLYLNINQSK